MPCSQPNSRLWGKTNLSHDGLNPAHVPYLVVNNHTFSPGCKRVVGRADIEGSKSNVAMNAWLPQASYPCGNFSDTSRDTSHQSKGSLGLHFCLFQVTESEFNVTFTLTRYERFPFSLSHTLGNSAIFSELCRPSQTPRLDVFLANLTARGRLIPEVGF